MCVDESLCCTTADQHNNVNQPSDQISRTVVSDSATPWIAARQASLSITNSRSSPAKVCCCKSLQQFCNSLQKFVVVQSLSHVRLFATPWSVAHQALPSMGFYRQEYLSGLPFHSPGDLRDPGVEPESPASFVLAAKDFIAEPPGWPYLISDTLFNLSGSNLLVCKTGVILVWRSKNTKFIFSFHKEIKLVNPKGNQPWIFIGRTDAETEALILWLPDVKSWLTEKDPDAGKDRRQKEKREAEEMVR